MTDNNKTFLTKEAIFDIPLGEEELYIPQWDGKVLIREMTAAQIEQNARNVIKKNGKPDYSKAVAIPTSICARQVINPETGKRLFTDKDIARLSQKHGSAISQIAAAVNKLSGRGKADKDYESLTEWLEDNHPNVLAEYEADNDPVEQAEENFT